MKKLLQYVLFIAVLAISGPVFAQSYSSSAPSGGGGPPTGAAGGALSGTYPNPTINLTGNASISGLLPLANTAGPTGSGLVYTLSGTTQSAALLGTAGQELYVNSAGTQVAFATCTGDVTCSATTVGQNNVVSIGSLAGGTINLSDATHALALTMKTSVQATPPALSLTGSLGFGATSANANPGGAASITAGAGGASVTSGTGGAGAVASLVGGAGGTSAGASANANGGNAILGSGAAGTGGGGTAGTPGSSLVQVGGTTVAQWNQASGDFVSGGPNPAAAGFLRYSNPAATLLAIRNVGNTADLPLITTQSTVGGATFGNPGGAAVLGNSTYFVSAPSTASGVVGIQSASGSIGGSLGIQFSNSIASGPALGIVPVYNGTTYLAFGGAVTAANITQVSAAGASATGTLMTVSAQNETGTTSTGGSLALSSGTGTSNPGALNLQVGGVTVDSAQCGVPVTGITHGGSASTLCTVAQATSATVTTYRVNFLCKATTLFTGGAATDAYRTEQEFTVRNVAGTLTLVSSVTNATSTQSDSSMSTNSPAASPSGTNINFTMTPPSTAAGAETCSAVSHVLQTL